MKTTNVLKRKEYIIKSNKKINYNTVGTFSRPHRQIRETCISISVAHIHNSFLDQTWLQAFQCLLSLSLLEMFNIN